MIVVISAIIGIVIGLIIASILYQLINKSKSNNKPTEDVKNLDAIYDLTREIKHLDDELEANNWCTRGDISEVPSEGKEALLLVNGMLDAVFGIFDSMPVVVAAFDKDVKFIFTNKFYKEQGFQLRVCTMYNSQKPPQIQGNL